MPLDIDFIQSQTVVTAVPAATAVGVMSAFSIKRTLDLIVLNVCFPAKADINAFLKWQLHSCCPT
jgi:anaerobic C4-dicarboxylate transporter